MIKPLSLIDSRKRHTLRGVNNSSLLWCSLLKLMYWTRGAGMTECKRLISKCECPICLCKGSHFRQGKDFGTKVSLNYMEFFSVSHSL